MKMNTSTKLVAFTAALSLMIGSASADTIMKVGHVVPDGAPRGQGANLMADILNKSDSCDITVQIYPSSQLGGTTDLIEGLQIGSVEMAILPASFMVGFQPLVGILDFPFYFPGKYDELSKIHESGAMRKLLDTTEGKGIHSISIWHTGYKTWTANKPMVTLSDYEGLRARVMPSAIIKEQDRLLKMQAVDMPFAETYAALQNGAIDTQENPIDTNYFMKFYEVQDYITLSNHGTLDQIVAVSKLWWDGLDETCRTEITAAASKGAVLTVQKTYEVIEQLAIPAFKANGTKIVEVPEKIRGEIAAAILPKIKEYYLKQNGDAGAAILNAFDAALAK